MNHQERLNQLLKRSNAHPKDLERKAMFYILAGNEDLFNKVNDIYDFEERCIRPEILESNLTMNEISLISLAFNHYNQYPVNVDVVLYGLNDEDFTLAINSMIMRYRKGDI